MRCRVTSVAASIGLILVGTIGGYALSAQGRAGTPAPSAPAAPSDTAKLRADYEQWRTAFKTWNRWGADDNKGTSNLITPQKVLSALKLVKSGTVISLASNEPQQAAADVGANGVFHRTTNAITEGG